MKNNRNIEVLNLKTLDMAYNKRMQMLHPHISPFVTKVSRSKHKKEKALQVVGNETVGDGISVAVIIQDAKNEGKDIVTEIKQYLPVMEVEI